METKNNSFVDNLVKQTFEYYESLYNSIDENWKNRSISLIKELFARKNRDAILFLINNYNSKNLKYISFYAGYYNDIDILSFVKNIDYREVALGAAETGNLKCIQFALDNGADNYEKIIMICAKYGYLDIIEYIVNIKGINMYQEIAEISALNKHKNILEYALDRGVKDFRYIANNAAKSGDLNIVKYVVSKCAKYFQEIANYSAYCGYEDIMHYAIENGGNNFQEIGYWASWGGRKNIVIYALEHGAHDVGEILLQAVIQKHQDIVEYMTSKYKLQCSAVGRLNQDKQKSNNTKGKGKSQKV